MVNGYVVVVFLCKFVNLGIKEINFLLYLCCGLVNSCLVGVIFSSVFICMILMWLYIWWIIGKLWLINSMVRLSLFCRFFSKLRICVCIDIFSVEVGLL